MYGKVISRSEELEVPGSAPVPGITCLEQSAKVAEEALPGPANCTRAGCEWSEHSM
jgi:hypothetical protein